MPYIHTGMEVPKDNQVREGINSGLILSAIKWSDCIVSHISITVVLVLIAFTLAGDESLSAGTSLELTETPVMND